MPTTISTALAIALVLAGRVASADCAAPRGSMQTVSAEVVFLGRYQDIVGHTASFYFDPARNVVIGPVDHDAWRGRKGPAAIALQATVKAGDAGTLTLRGWVDDPSQPTRTGFFVRFAPGKTHAELGPIVDRLDDWFAIGLLAGRSPAEAQAAERIETLRTHMAAPHDREHLAAAADGVLDAAPLPRAQQLLASYGIRNYGGARLDRVATAVRGGRKALAAQPPEPNKRDWTDYLPELAAAWDHHPGDLRNALDDLVLGQPAPTGPPPVADHAVAEIFHCGPMREDTAGPFITPAEMSGAVILEALRGSDRAFADKVADAFTGVAAGAADYVAALRTIDHRDIVFVIGHSAGAIAAIEVSHAQAAQLSLGTKLRYVARRSVAPLILPLLDPKADGLAFEGTVTRIDPGPVDAPALIAALKRDAVSGNLAFAAGHALAVLVELADHVPGWKLDDARAFITSLPGNVYDMPQQWASTWSEIFGWALRYSQDGVLADELERAMPTIVGQFGRRGKQASVEVPGEVVRTFAIDLAIEIAARRLAANDLPGASRILARAAGPLPAIAGSTRLSAETHHDPNHALELVMMQAVVAGLDHSPVTLPADVDRQHALLLLLDKLRPYAPALRARWTGTVSKL